MITLNNKLRQPLTVTLADKKSIHFLAKESKDLTDAQFASPEIQEYIDNGTLVVTRLG